MTVQNTAETQTATGLAKVLSAFRSVGKMDMAFGGTVRPNATALDILSLSGAYTRALANLVVHPGEGLGGKALMLKRPVSVDSYLSAQGITHVFDHAVSAENLETVVALPIMVDEAPRMVVYLGSRSRIALGDRWFDRFAPLVRKVAHDISVDDEVRRRLSRLTSLADAQPEVPMTVSDMHEIAEELADVVQMMPDDALRARVDHVRSRFASATPHNARQGEDVALSRREIDVLAQVALGRTNQQAAAHLGLLPNTVKSYLKTAMRKLNAENRVQAMLSAQKAGLIS